MNHPHYPERKRMGLRWRGNEPLTRQLLYEKSLAKPDHEVVTMKDVLKENATLNWLKSVFSPDKSH